MSLLSIRGLVTEYRPADRGAPVRAVDGVDLDVDGGEVVGLIGESGCGKTSLVRCALGLVPRVAGAVSVGGIDPHRAGRDEPRLRRFTQLLFQDAGASLNPGLTVRATLRESLRVFHPGAPDGAARIEDALRRVDLLHRADALPRQLSGGERRRATLAQLHLARPRLVVADEPTAGLDASRKAELLDLLLADRGPENGYLIISHDLPLVLYACTRVLVMARGRVVDAFTPATLARDARHPVTRSLLEAAGMTRATA